MVPSSLLTCAVPLCATHIARVRGARTVLQRQRGEHVSDRCLSCCAAVFEQVEDPKSKTFFSEIIASISDCKFTAEGNHIIARDYLTVKVWDIRMESEPVTVIPTHEHLRRKLCDLYENDCIFDKFECCTSGDGKFVMTGSYSNCFNIYDREGRHETCIEVRCGYVARRACDTPLMRSHVLSRCPASGLVHHRRARSAKAVAERTHHRRQTWRRSTSTGRCCTLHGTRRTTVWRLRV